MASLVNACIFLASAAGTGTFTVAAAVPGWRTPAQASAVDGASYRYRAYSADQTEWEIGTGVYDVATTTLTRAVIEASSNANAAVNFTDPPNVALTAFAAEFPTQAQLDKIDFLTVTQAVDLDALESKLAFISVTQAVDLDTLETDVAASKTKTDFITVTQAVDLDDIETRVNALDAAVVLKGTWDASAGTFPGGGTAQAGDSYIVSVAGTVDGVAFVQNDRIIAILDNASTTTFAANWFKADYTDQVLSVAGKTGAVTIQVADITDMSANGRSLTSAANYAAMRALLDLEAGTDFYSIAAANAAFQASDADLTSWAGVSRAAGFDTFVATPSSANLRSLLTDETGTGAAVFATSPAIATPTLTNPVITGAILEDIYTITDGAAFEIDPGNGSLQRVTLGASRTPKATNFANGESVTLMIADGTAFTVTWTDATFGGSGVVWKDATAPTLATTGWTIVELWKEGGQVRGAIVGDFAS